MKISNLMTTSVVVCAMAATSGIMQMMAAAAPAIPATESIESRAASYPSVPASKIKSYALWGWGPLEKSANGVDMVILDGDLESAATIKKLRSQGKFVTCYMSAGTVENWRKDAGKFSSNQAKKYRGFGGKETWLDITQWEKLKGPMGDRIKMYGEKGCNAVEFDNIDCYGNMCVAGASYDTLVKKQVEYVRWLADAAHARGMAAGMKNAVELIPQLEGKMQFAINESCQQWGKPNLGAECGLYSAFTKKNKVVVGVEYNNNGGKVCSEAKKYKMVTKYLSGGKWSDCF